MTLTHNGVEYRSVTSSEFDNVWPTHYSTASANSAVTKYTGSAYSSINTQLRTDSVGSQASTIQDLKEWFRTAPATKENLLVYRGVGNVDRSNFHQYFKPGGKYQDKGFISTSAVKGSNFSGYQLTILIPKGSKGAAKVRHLSHYRSENEVLLNSGLFEVVSADSNGATLIYKGPAKK